MGQYSDSEKLDEIEREIKMREFVYGKMESRGPRQNRQLAIMREIAEEYREKAKKERLL